MHRPKVLAAVCGALLVVSVALLLVPRPRAANDALTVWAIEDPAAFALATLATDPRWSVRWVERGLVVFEADAALAPPDAWGARAIATRPVGWDLGIARGREAEVARTRHARAVTASARLRAAAGGVWVGVAPPGTLPEDVCHADVFRAPQSVDPRSSLDAGAPAVLAAAAAAAQAGRPLAPELSAVVDQVAVDSLAAWVALVARTPGGDPADRFVRNADLQSVYIPLVEATMRRIVNGVAGAVVELQPVVVDAQVTSYNVVARVPGSVPGSGKFVVSAHLDATGSQDPGWVADVGAGLPVFTPGAEDNGSGVAAVIEVLRCLAAGFRDGSLDVAVDLEFIAFTAEEIGLVGSDRYVRQTHAAPLLGCLNFDMVAYDDSLPGNLTIAHNPQSRWLAQFVHDAALDVAPPRVTPSLDLDEARASDHNSFWTVGAAGILLADAPVNTLRRYDTYHRPIDRIERVDFDKLAQVTRAALAALVRFDTGFAAEPRMAFAPEDLQLRFRSGGQLFRYVPGFHRLVPGAPLYALATVHNLGAAFAGTLRFELTASRGGSQLAVFDSSYTVSVPTASQFVFQRQIPILGGDGGWHRLVTRVTSRPTGGSAVTSSAQDSFLVESTQPPPLALVVRPNPVRDWTLATLEFPARGFPGRADIEIYDLEGQRVATLPGVTPQLQGDAYSVSLAAAPPGGRALDVRSGAYIVRLVWRDATGRVATATAPVAVVR